MKDKIWESFDEVVADISDGATIMVFSWGVAGTPQNLLRALQNKGTKELTIITHAFIPGWVGSHICTEEELMTPFFLMNQVRKLITTWPRPIEGASEMAPAVEKALNKIELEVTSHGVLIERIRAGGSGIGGFYSPIGAGTVLEKGKEKKMIDGKEYLLEEPLAADYSFVRASKADRRGNLIYRGSGRGANPIMAMAGNVTIAEVDEIVEVGELDPESIVTPSIFVDRIVRVPDGALGSLKQRNELCKRYLMSEV